MGNYLKQLEQMEQNHALFACLSPDQKRIIFTESLSGGPSQRLYQIQVQGIQSAGTTLQARVTLNALH
jgi:nicotinamide mononucleotide (NMN) deamidase PncC